MSATISPRYVIVTGGVVSSLGKGIVAASLGNLLRARGLSVRLVKLDPYLNLDPGTMAPRQHGEVFVTKDGTETDLDLGHYERFTGVPCSRLSTHTSGTILTEVLRKERAGEYLGQTVQVIPHVTDEIISRVTRAGEGTDVCIVEVGGTIGDIEGLYIVEALRQLRRQVGPQRMCIVQATLVPWIAAAGELKTKPTQHAVAIARQLGLHPDVLVLRAEQPVPADQRAKIAAFCDLPDEAVISGHDARSIYEVPLILHANGLDRIVCDRLALTTGAPELDDWRAMCERLIGASVQLKVAVIAKYTDHQDAYISIVEALKHAAAANHRALRILWVDAEQVSTESASALLAGADAILVPGGFGERGVEGKIAAARYARETGTPYLGICLGMQVAVIEFARNVLGLRSAHSREFAPKGRNCVIDLSPEQRGVKGMGGTMRLGEQEAALVDGTLVQRLYGTDRVRERHRHRYEVNERYVPDLEDAGLIISARHPQRGLVECVELAQEAHPFYVAGQFHPEFESRPTAPHPLFLGLIQAALR